MLGRQRTDSREGLGEGRWQRGFDLTCFDLIGFGCIHAVFGMSCVCVCVWFELC